MTAMSVVSAPSVCALTLAWVTPAVPVRKPAVTVCANRQRRVRLMSIASETKSVTKGIATSLAKGRSHVIRGMSA